MPIKEYQSEPDRYDEPVTFAVTVESVIGTVTIDPYGDGPSPQEAAFKLIARYDNEGKFEFPIHNGKTCVVHVEYKEADPLN